MDLRRAGNARPPQPLLPPPPAHIPNPTSSCAARARSARRLPPRAAQRVRIAVRDAPVHLAAAVALLRRRGRRTACGAARGAGRRGRCRGYSGRGI
eukprot:gene19409-biopygen20528